MVDLVDLVVLVVLVDLVDLVDLKDPVNGFIRNRQSLTGSTRAKQCQPGPTNKFRNRSSKKQEAALGTKKIKCHVQILLRCFFYPQVVWMVVNKSKKLRMNLSGS